MGIHWIKTRDQYIANTVILIKHSYFYKNINLKSQFHLVGLTVNSCRQNVCTKIAWSNIKLEISIWNFLSENVASICTKYIHTCSNLMLNQKFPFSYIMEGRAHFGLVLYQNTCTMLTINRFIIREALENTWKLNQNWDITWEILPI